MVIRKYGELNKEGFVYNELSNGEIWFHTPTDSYQLSEKIPTPEALKFDNKTNLLSYDTKTVKLS